MNGLAELDGGSSQLLFRLLALPVVAFFLVRSLRGLLKPGPHRRAAGMGSVIWLLAGVGIARPTITTKVAGLLGIGRGADLIAYLTALAFLASFFYFYRKNRKLESDLTTLVRRLAIEEARARPNDEGEGPSAVP